MNVYVAGPMRGYPELNHPAFHDAAARLRALGHEVYSPAEHPAEMNGKGEPATPALREELANDLAYICREAEMVVVLAGWTASSGANAEVAAAKALGVPILPLEDALRQ